MCSLGDQNRVAERMMKIGGLFLREGNWGRTHWIITYPHVPSHLIQVDLDFVPWAINHSLMKDRRKYQLDTELVSVIARMLNRELPSWDTSMRKNDKNINETSLFKFRTTVLRQGIL